MAIPTRARSSSRRDAQMTNEGTIEASDDTNDGNSGSLTIADVVNNSGTIRTIETGNSRFQEL